MNILLLFMFINFIIDLPYKQFINISVTLLILYVVMLLFFMKKIKLNNVISIETILLSLFVIYSTLIGGIIAIDTSLFFGKVQTMIQIWLMTICIVVAVLLNRDEKWNMYILFFVPLIVCINLIMNGSLQNIDINELERVSVDGMNPNMFGYLLVNGIIALLYFRNKFKFVLALAILPLFFYSILQTGSRNAYIGFLITFIVWVLVVYIPERLKKKKSPLAIISITFVFFIFLAGFNYITGTLVNDTVVGKRMEYVGDTSDGSIAVRLQLYRESFNVFIDNFLFGVGLDQFRVYSVLGKYTHSDYMEILAGTGIIGALLYFPIYAILYVKLFYIVKNSTSAKIVFTSRIYQMSIIVMLYYGFGRPWYDQVIRWFLLATIIGFVIIYKDFAKRSLKDSSSPNQK